VLNQVAVVSGQSMRKRPRTSLNRLPDISDWRMGSRFVEILRELNEGTYIHRKSWEYALCIEGLERLGVVTPGAKALAVGAGYERPLFYYANRIDRMIATDLYDNPEHEGKPQMLTEPWAFAPFDYRRERLDVLRMRGDDLQFAADSFDFLFCLSSIEHFGSRDTIAKAVSEMKRVLKIGGVACIITELILRGASHHEYFTLAELDGMFLRDPGFSLVGGAVDTDISEEMISLAVDVRSSEDLSFSPHIVLTDGERTWTSFSMFLQKQA
jgi:SAM-dependent methyltransferase